MPETETQKIERLSHVMRWTDKNGEKRKCVRELIGMGSKEAFNELLKWAGGEPFDDRFIEEKLADHKLAVEELSRLKDRERLVTLVSEFGKHNGDADRIIVMSMDEEKAYPEIVELFIKKAKAVSAAWEAESALHALARFGTDRAVRALADIGFASTNEGIMQRTTGLLHHLYSAERNPLAMKLLITKGLAKEGGMPRAKRAVSIGECFKRYQISPELIVKHGLKSRNLELNLGSVEALRAIGGDEAARVLMRHGVTAKHDGIAFAAIKMLAKVISDDKPSRLKAMKAIIKHGLRKRNAMRASASVESLIEIGSEDSVEAVIMHGVTHPSPKVAVKSLEALREFRIPKEYIPIVVRHGLRNKDRRVAQHAVSTLREWKHKEAVAPIARYGLTHKHPDVVRESVKALRDMGGRRAVEPLLRHGVGHPNAEVRATAAEALGDIGDRRAVPALIRLLSSRSKDVVWRSAEALGNIRDKRALVPLMRLADHEDKDVRKNVKEAIRMIRGAKHA